MLLYLGALSFLSKCDFKITCIFSEILREEDDNIKELKKNFPKNASFITTIPQSLCEDLLPGKSVCIIDDHEETLATDKTMLSILKYASSVGIHHKKLIFLVALQTYGCFYKRHVLNSVLYNATSLILFRSVSTFTTLKRWLNSYEIKLKANQTLYDVFKTFVQGERYAYLVIDISPCLKNARAYSQILYCDQRPMLIFNVE